VWHQLIRSVSFLLIYMYSIITELGLLFTLLILMSYLVTHVRDLFTNPLPYIFGTVII